MPAPDTFCSRIAQDTRSAHRRAESQAFVVALMGGELDVRSVVHLLEALLPVYEELEERVGSAARDPSVRRLHDARLARAARLRADLHRLGRRTLPRPGRVTREYVAIVRDSAASPQRLLAHHYTRYLGDLAGGQAIARLLHRHYGVESASLSHYDFADLGDLVDYRRRYRAALDAMPWAPAEQAEFITECSVAYDVNARLFAMLAEDSGVVPPAAPVMSGFLSRERGHVVSPR